MMALRYRYKWGIKMVVVDTSTTHKARTKLSTRHKATLKYRAEKRLLKSVSVTSLKEEAGRKVSIRFR